MTAGRFHDGTTGRFVSAEDAASDPHGTQFIPNTPAPALDPVDVDLARIEEITQSKLVWQATIAGQTFSHTDPREVARLAREHVERLAGVG